MKSNFNSKSFILALSTAALPLLMITSCDEERIEQVPSAPENEELVLHYDPLDRWGFEDHNAWNSSRNPGARVADDKVSWSYSGNSGPVSWGSLSPEFINCAEGKRQSPIDISERNSINAYWSKQNNLNFFYRNSPLKVVNNSHTIEFSPKQGNYLSLGYDFWNLAQFHVHAASEHTINGKQSPLEIHFVHTNVNNDKELLVVGLLVEEGAYNKDFGRFWNNFPTKDFATSEIKQPVDLLSLLPDDKSTFRYSGSLTTPPCSEGVLWNVLTEKIEMSKEQIAVFTSLFANNYRPVQKLNGRNIFEIINKRY